MGRLSPYYMQGCKFLSQSRKPIKKVKAQVVKLSLWGFMEADQPEIHTPAGLMPRP